MIHDGTDALGHKGHVIGDKDWGRFWDRVDAALTVAAKGREESAAMALTQADPARRIWECRACGRLWVEGAGGGLTAYAPQSGRYGGVLDR